LGDSSLGISSGSFISFSLLSLSLTTVVSLVSSGSFEVSLVSLVSIGLLDSSFSVSTTADSGIFSVSVGGTISEVH